VAEKVEMVEYTVMRRAPRTKRAESVYPVAVVRQARDDLDSLLAALESGVSDTDPRAMGEAVTNASQVVTEVEPAIKRLKSDAIFLMRKAGLLWEEINTEVMGINRARGYQLLKGGGPDSLWAQEQLAEIRRPPDYVEEQ
jgi:hypothetical protein